MIFFKLISDLYDYFYLPTETLPQSLAKPCECSSILSCKTQPIFVCEACNIRFDTQTGVDLEKCLKEHFLEKLRNSLQLLKRSSTEFNAQISQFRVVICDHFASIRNDIDIKREILMQDIYAASDEKLLEEINKLSGQLMTQLENRERDFVHNFNHEINRNRVELDFDSQFQRLNRLDSLDEMREMKTDLESKVCVSRARLKGCFKLFEFYLNRNKLVTDSTESKLGKLELAHEYFECKIDDSEVFNIITCSHNKKEIHMLNLNTNFVIQSFDCHSTGVRCLALYGDDKLISGGADKVIQIRCLLILRSFHAVFKV